MCIYYIFILIYILICIHQACCKADIGCMQDIKAKLLSGDAPPKHHIVITSYQLAQKMQGYEKQ